MKINKKSIGFYQIQEQIGSGGFGCVCKVRSTEDDRPYAMKIEPLNAKRATLSFEISVLKKLNNSDRFPAFVFDGTEDNDRFLVEELLGPNLNMITKNLPGEFYDQKHIAKLADEMLHCIEALHKQGYVHRDVKPQNFVVRLDGKVAICLVDFGISKLYRDQSGKHIGPKQHSNGIGSPIYASVNSHNQTDLSRRDDLISLLYSILSISRCRLPWQYVQGIEEIGKLKKQNKLSDLCKPLGSGFVEFAKHVEALGYEDTPDYSFLHRELAKHINKDLPPYQWMTISVDGQVSGGSNDPTGFLLKLAPYIKTEQKGGVCLIS